MKFLIDECLSPDLAKLARERLELQKRLFLLAVSELSGEEAWNQALDITVDADREVAVDRFDLSG